MASRHPLSQSFLRGGQKFLSSLKTGALYRAGQREPYEHGNDLGVVPARGRGLVEESYYSRAQYFTRLLVANVAGGCPVRWSSNRAHWYPIASTYYTSAIIGPTFLTISLRRSG